LFYAGATVNFSGTPAFLGVAGPWSVLSSQCTFDKTTTSAVTFSNFAIDVQNTFKSTTGISAFNGSEYAMNHRPILETGVSGGTFCAAISNAVTLNGTATAINSFGFLTVPRSHASSNNIGYGYTTIDNMLDDAVEYSFYASAGTHNIQAGQACKVTIVTTVAPTLGLEDYAISLTGTAACVLPAVTAVPTGMTYKVLNISGGTRFVTSASTIAGVTPLIADDASRTFINDGAQWLSMY
jgi:hypothetical protein